MKITDAIIKLKSLDQLAHNLNITPEVEIAIYGGGLFEFTDDNGLVHKCDMGGRTIHITARIPDYKTEHQAVKEILQTINDDEVRKAKGGKINNTVTPDEYEYARKRIKIGGK